MLKAKDEFGRDIGDWSQGEDKVKDLVGKK